MAPEVLELAIRAAKPAVLALVAGLGALWAQIELPGLDGLGSVGLVGILAVLIGRYTFRQLEDYRKDLQAARERIDELEADLHELGQAKARTDHRNRELEAYAHRLQLWATAASGGHPIEPPQFPEAPPTPA